MHQNLSDGFNLEKQKILSELIKKYGKDVLKVAYVYSRNKESAEDIFQEVFVRVYRHLDTYDSLIDVKSWIMKITTNICRDAHKNYWRNKVVLCEDFNELEIEYPESFSEDSGNRLIENKNAVWTALNALPLDYKDVLILYCMEEYSYKEISGILQIPLNTVRTRITRARAAFRKTYERMVGNG